MVVWQRLCSKCCNGLHRIESLTWNVQAATKTRQSSLYCFTIKWGSEYTLKEKFSGIKESSFWCINERLLHNNAIASIGDLWLVVVINRNSSLLASVHVCFIKAVLSPSPPRWKTSRPSSPPFLNVCEARPWRLASSPATHSCPPIGCVLWGSSWCRTRRGRSLGRAWRNIRGWNHDKLMNETC